MVSTQAVVPASPASATGRAVPVSRKAENGGPTGSDTSTASGPAASHRARGDPAAGSRRRLPSLLARTGTGLGASGPPGTLAALTLAAASRASAVLASSGSEGRGGTSSFIIY